MTHDEIFNIILFSFPFNLSMICEKGSISLHIQEQLIALKTLREN